MNHWNREKILIVLTIAAALFSWSCNNNKHEHNAEIKAVFSYSASNKVYLHELLPDSWPVVDSAISSEKGEVTFVLHESTPGLYTIGTDRDNLVILQSNPGENQELKADIRQIPYTYTTKGSEGSKLLENFKKQTQQHLDEIDSLFLEMNMHRDSSNFLQKKAITDSLIEQVSKKQIEYQTELVRKNNDKLAVLIPLFQPFGRKPVLTLQDNTDLFYKIEKKLLEKYPENAHVLELHKMVEKHRDEQEQAAQTEAGLAEGKPAPKFSITDVEQNTIALEQLKGKYVLLDFWTGNPSDTPTERADAYNTSAHYTNLVHLSIYQGTDKLLWRRLAERFKKRKIHSLANAMLLNMYNSKNKDRMFLIGPEGNILANDFNSSELKQVLEKHL